MPIESRDWYRYKQKCTLCGNPIYPNQARCSFCSIELPSQPPSRGALDLRKDQGTKKPRDEGQQRIVKKELTPLQACSLCGERSLSWNKYSQKYECLNSSCEATGDTPTSLFSWKRAVERGNKKQSRQSPNGSETVSNQSAILDKRAEQPRSDVRGRKKSSSQQPRAQARRPVAEQGQYTEGEHPPRGRAWWGNEYYDIKKRRWRKPGRSPSWVVKLCLNLIILMGLGFLIRFGYNVFIHQTEPVRDFVILILGIVTWILLIKLLRSRRYRRVGPSFKLTAFSAVLVFLILGFAGVQPLAAYKDALVESLASAANTIRSTAPTTVSPLGTSYTEDEVEELIIVLVNEERQRFGLLALGQDHHLTGLAREHSISMIENSYFSHDRYPGQRSFDYGQPPGTIRGENLSKTPIRRLIPGPYLSLQEVCDWAVSGWMNSPGHRDNILESRFAKTGVGVSLSGGYLYITQIFEGAY